jgi:cytochrome P450
MQVRTKQHPFTTDKDVSSQAFWSLPFIERDKTFAWLRKHAPVSWHPPVEVPSFPPEVHGEAGFWAVVRAADVAFVSLNHRMFSSDVELYGTPTLNPAAATVTQRRSFFHMDPPEHTAYRRLWSQHFTPKGVARIQQKMNERAEDIVDRVVGAGEIDFVREVSSKLPMRTIADIVGVPEDLAETFADAGDKAIAVLADPSVAEGENVFEFVMKQLAVLREIGIDVVADRRKHPADDLATALAETEIDGRRLDDLDIEAAMLLLSVAGNDTTKQTTSHTVIQLWGHPEQMQWLQEDFDNRIGTATEEFLRYATPVMNFARTAVVDVELGGSKIEAGDKVAVFYCSSNRDEAVFDDPHRFDITRPPTAHQAFGGGGVHHCLGSFLAKAQLRALFGQILSKLPNMEVGEPEMLKGDWLHGVHRLPVRIP